MDYRDAVETVERAMPHADVGETKRLADALMAAYEAGRTEREPLVPDAQGYLHVTEFHYERLMADHRRMNYIRVNWKIADDKEWIMVQCDATGDGANLNLFLDAAIEQKASSA